MKSTLLFSALAVLVCLPVSASSFDRDAIHHERLEGLDLAARALLSELPKGGAQQPLFSDLQVSTSGAPARFKQDHAQIVTLSDNGWLVIWDDDRLGSRKIYWQRFDPQGSRIGDNELIASSTVGSNYIDPVGAIDTPGRVCLFFRDQTNGLIYGSRYTSNLQPDLAPFLVNDTSLNSYAGPFGLALFQDGQMVVAWENYSGLGSTIEMRMYSPSGSPLIGPLTVNTDGGSAQHWVPSVAVSSSGLAIIWEDHRFGRADIFARQYTGAGNPVAGEFALVPPPDDASDQYAPAVIYTSKDKYVIGWIDKREGQEIYLQRFDPTTGLEGGNQLISSGDTLVTNWNLDLSVTANKQVMAAWSDFGAANRILGLELDSGLTAVGSPTVKNLGVTGQRWRPAASFDTLDNYAMVWTEIADDDANINLMLFDSLDRRTLVEEVEVNDDDIGASSTDPEIISTTDWYNLICFADRRNDAGDIYVRAVSVPGVFAAGEERANQDAGVNLQSEPALASSSTEALVIWNDSRMVSGSSGQHIYGRYVSHFGIFSEDEFMISDTSSNAIKTSPKVAMSPDGQGLVAWIDMRNGNPQVWGRWLAGDGTLDGLEFLISSPVSDSSAVDLHVCVDMSDNFYVVWLDDGLTEPAVRSNWYLSDKSEGDSFSWVSDVMSVDVEELAADVNPDGTLTLFWSGSVGEDRPGYMTQLASDGSTVVGSFGVIEGLDPNISDISVSVSNNAYHSLAWIDIRDGFRRAYRQLFTSSLATIGNNEPISVAMPEFMTTPFTDAYRGRAWFVWADPRQDGLNIYASNYLYNPTEVTEETESPLPDNYRLSQNYPNPFNPNTQISFTIPERSNVTIRVYNTLGQAVTTLADGEFSAGENYVTWNGRDSFGAPVASGVYLYRLDVGNFTETRKMLLLK